MSIDIIVFKMVYHCYMGSTALMRIGLAVLGGYVPHCNIQHLQDVHKVAQNNLPMRPPDLPDHESSKGICLGRLVCACQTSGGHAFGVEYCDFMIIQQFSQWNIP